MRLLDFARRLFKLDEDRLVVARMHEGKRIIAPQGVQGHAFRSATVTAPRGAKGTVVRLGGGGGDATAESEGAGEAARRQTGADAKEMEFDAAASLRETFEQMEEHEREAAQGSLPRYDN